MKVKEFVEEIKVTTSIEELLKNIIKKTYIPVMEKKELALATLALSTTNDDGFMQVDEFKKDICFKMLFLKQYTTLEITDDFDSFINEYDVLESADVTEVFFDAYLCEEYKRALCILEQETKNLLNSNSIEAQLSKLIQHIGDSADSLIGLFNEKLEGFDISSILPEDMSTNEFIQIIERLK